MFFFINMSVYFDSSMGTVDTDVLKLKLRKMSEIVRILKIF